MSLNTFLSFSNDDETFLLQVTTLVLGAILLVTLGKQWNIVYHISLWFEYLTTSVPTIDVELTDAETQDDGVKGEPCKKMTLIDPKKPKILNCYDPSTRQLLGHAKVMDANDVHELLVKAKAAQAEWKTTTYKQRRQVLRTIQKYICDHIEEICRVSARESGKPNVDAVLGEVMTTCEKIRTICAAGELWLKPEYRESGPMLMYKSAWVEYVPLGVIATIAPWK